MNGQRILLLTAALLAAPGWARAQGTATAPTARDSAIADSIAAAGRAAYVRASWTSDRVTLRPGDLVTVVVDEETQARERVSQVAVGDRNLGAQMNAGIGSDARLGPVKSFGSGMQTDSRDVGEANRIGNLTAVLTAVVTGIGQGGELRIAGTKKVTVDGRLQEITLTGMVRPSDVSPSNVVLSSHIADAVIGYKGKKIGPRTGIAGRILGLLWP